MKASTRSWRIGLPVLAAIAAALGAGSAVWVEVEARRLADERRVEHELARQLELAQRQDPAAASTAAAFELAGQPDVAGQLQALATIGAAAGVQLAQARPLPATTPGRQSFHLAGRGTPAAVCTFVAGIETSARLFVLESGSVEPASGEELAFEVAVSAFHGRTGGG